MLAIPTCSVALRTKARACRPGFTFAAIVHRGWNLAVTRRAPRPGAPGETNGIRAPLAEAAIVCATSGTPPDLANIRLLS